MTSRTDDSHTGDQSPACAPDTGDPGAADRRRAGTRDTDGSHTVGSHADDPDTDDWRRAGTPDAADWRHAAETGSAQRDRAEAVEGDRRVPSWSPPSVSIPAHILEQLSDWARAGVPNEACGLIASAHTPEEGGVPTRFIAMRNAEASPYRYRMDPQELLEAILDIEDRAEEVVWGIFHSHVASRPVPSVTDIGLASYPDALYVICSLESTPPVVRAWAIEDGRVGEVVLHLC